MPDETGEGPRTTRPEDAVGAATPPTPSLTFRELKIANVSRCLRAYHPLDSWSPTDWACAMAGEAGEACNIVKKIRRLQATPLMLPEGHADYEPLREALAKELADTVIYVDLLAVRMNINLEDAIRQKFNEVSDRMGSTQRL